MIAHDQPQPTTNLTSDIAPTLGNAGNLGAAAGSAASSSLSGLSDAIAQGRVGGVGSDAGREVAGVADNLAMSLGSLASGLGAFSREVLHHLT